MVDEESHYFPLLSLSAFIIWSHEHVEQLFAGHWNQLKRGAPCPVEWASRPTAELLSRAQKNVEDGEISFVGEASWAEFLAALQQLELPHENPWHAISDAVQGLLKVKVGTWGWPFDADGVRVVVVVVD